MAVPSYTSNLVDIYAGAGTITGWSPLGGGASGLNAETDYFIQGTGMTSKNAFASTTKGMIYSGGAVTIPTDGAILMWITHQTANSLDTIAAGGLQALVGSSSTAFKQFYVGGSDTIVYDDRWLCIPIDPSLTASATTGSPTTTRSFFGVQTKMVGGPTKGAPLGADAIRYGRGYDYTDGQAGSYATFLGAATKNDLIANRYGLIQLTGTTYKMQGLHKLGTVSTAVDFRDSNRTINIANTLFVTANFNGFEVNNASSNVEWTNISVSALGTVSRGNFIVNANATVALVGCTFSDMETFTFLSNSSCTDTVFRRTGVINLGGGSLTTCTISNSRVASSVSAATLDNIVGCSFVSDGSNHAVELSSIGGGSMDWDNTLSGYVAGAAGSPVTPTSTGNEAIYVNVGSGTLTINVQSGASVPSIRSAGATVNVVAGAVALNVNVKNTAGTNIENARVLVTVESGGSYPYQESISIAVADNSSLFWFDGSDVAVTDPGGVWVNETNLDDSDGDTWATLASPTPSEFYFDGSDAAAYDPNGVWTDETNLDDGDNTTRASGILGSETSNYVELQGTNAIGLTDAQLNNAIIKVRFVEYNVDQIGSELVYQPYVTLNAPAGGWTLAKLQGLEFRLWLNYIQGATSEDNYAWEVYEPGDAGGTGLASTSTVNPLTDWDYRPSKVEVQVTLLTDGSETLNYVEIQGTSVTGYTDPQLVDAIVEVSVRNRFSVVTDGSPWAIIEPPGGTWTLAKLQALEVRLWQISVSGSDRTWGYEVYDNGDAGGTGLSTVAPNFTVPLNKEPTGIQIRISFPVTVTVTHTAHGMINGDLVVIEGATFNEFNGVKVISNVTTNTYDYTVTTAYPTGSVAGTLIATTALISGLTNASGLISDTRTYSLDQPIGGRVRKSTSSPYYKTGQIVGTVSKDNGLALTIVLLSDE